MLIKGINILVFHVLLLFLKLFRKMTQIEFKDGTKFIVDSDKLRNFLIENGTPYKDYLEYIVRKKLGQPLNSFVDYVNFKNSRKDNPDVETEHLRFQMCGQRDSDGGIDENRQIFKLFNLPITLRASNDYEDYNPNEYGNIFIFHKGTPILFQRSLNGELMEIEQYGGYGTVEILVLLITKFSLSDVVQDELEVL